ncbi:hypothetical protein [Holospora undulata]|uniref:Uncharacterized protein n=1 Tax=Holospora undulata HU1 TaxID=1321371 RepID=A0A061JGE0_9PROT|nr:hypothetical protein [Holospora undulata]ETZ05091.1 hypothetical protein K737_300479 [Holospora undulata HU1]
MQEKMMKSTSEGESIDDILQSIRGLVYPVIDLNRPIQKEGSDSSVQKENSDPLVQKEFSGSISEKDVAPNGGENLQKESDCQKNNASAAQALFSFIHSVRRDKQEDNPLQEVINKEVKKSISLEAFLTEVIRDALNPHIKSVLEQEMRSFLGLDGKVLMENLIVQWFDVHGKDVIRIWLEKHAPALVVKCVEVYLKELSKNA